MITSKQVEHVAELARIELDKKEVKKYQAQLDKILGYVEKLQEVETEGVVTSDGGTRDLENVFRRDEDIREKKIESESLIDMAPEVEKNQIKVKSIFK